MTPSRHDAARGAAWGGGALAGAGAAGLGILVAQARQAKRRIGRQRWVPPYQDGRFGPNRGTSIRLAILGDSAAAGLGADDAADTVSGVLARGVIDATGRPVTVTNHAVVGAQSADLDRQVTRCLSARPHVAVIIVGANDVTHLTPRPVAARQLRAAMQRLIDAGCAVVIGTCPDLGTIRPVGPPLRHVARRMSRSLARTQARTALQVGAVPVALHGLLGAEFEANAEALFSPDSFHPSGLGYRRIGQALLPAVLDALGVAPVSGRRMLTAGPAAGPDR
jgi:lysophospholipase L1-like esterase